MTEWSGFEPLDPPMGGVSRLRRELQSRADDTLPLLPWATAAGLLLVVLVASYRGESRLTERILVEVQEADPAAWRAMPLDDAPPSIILVAPLPIPGS